MENSAKKLKEKEERELCELEINKGREGWMGLHKSTVMASKNFLLSYTVHTIDAESL